MRRFKLCAMKRFLFLTVFCGGLANAQTSAPVVAPSVVAPSASPSWLESRGVFNAQDLERDLAATWTPGQRETIEKAVAARNLALQNANGKFAEVLREITGQNDAQIEKRAAEKSEFDKEAIQLERMKRLQPSRYQEIMRRKKAAEKAS